MPTCIDFHTHIFPDRVAGRAIEALVEAYQAQPGGEATTTGLLRAMDAAGVGRAVVCPVATRPDQVRSINRWVAGLDRARFIPFGAIHPGCEDLAQELAYLRGEGIRGVKLQPHFQGYDLEQPAVLRMIEALAELVIMMHGGQEIKPISRVPTTPEALLALHRRFPEHRMVIAHLGGYLMWKGVEELLVGENLWFDLSFTFDHLDDETISRLIEAHGPERILFASDYPWQLPSEALAGLRRLALSSELTAMILGQNASKLLGIEPD